MEFYLKIFRLIELEDKDPQSNNYYTYNQTNRPYTY